MLVKEVFFIHLLKYYGGFHLQYLGKSPTQFPVDEISGNERATCVDKGKCDIAVVEASFHKEISPAYH